MIGTNIALLKDVNGNDVHLLDGVSFTVGNLESVGCVMVNPEDDLLSVAPIDFDILVHMEEISSVKKLTGMVFASNLSLFNKLGALQKKNLEYLRKNNVHDIIVKNSKYFKDYTEGVCNE